MIMPSEYSHLGLGKPILATPGLMIHRKFRWVAQIFKEGKEIKRAQFVKVKSRVILVTDPHSGLPDLDYFQDTAITYYIPKDEKSRKPEDWTFYDLPIFDELVLALFDGCGCILERWILGDIKDISVKLAVEDDEDLIYEVTFNCCVHNYEDLCQPISTLVNNP